jgi:hypothetical protein
MCVQMHNPGNVLIGHARHGLSLLKTLVHDMPYQHMLSQIMLVSVFQEHETTTATLFPIKS